MKLLITAATLKEEIGNIIMPLFDPETTLRQFRKHVNAIETLITETDMHEVREYLKNHVKQDITEEKAHVISTLIMHAFNESI